MADTDAEATQVSEENENATEQDGHFTPERRELKPAEDFVWTNEVVQQAGLESGRSYAVAGNDLSGYVAVSPEYRTYGSDIDKPLMTEADHAQLRELGIHTDQQLSDARLGNALAGNAPGVVMATDPTARSAPKSDSQEGAGKNDAESSGDAPVEKGPEYVEEKEPPSGSTAPETSPLSPKL